MVGVPFYQLALMEGFQAEVSSSLVPVAKSGVMTKKRLHPPLPCTRACNRREVPPPLFPRVDAALTLKIALVAVAVAVAVAHTWQMDLSSSPV